MAKIAAFEKQDIHTPPRTARISGLKSEVMKQLFLA